MPPEKKPEPVQEKFQEKSSFPLWPVLGVIVSLVILGGLVFWVVSRGIMPLGKKLAPTPLPQFISTPSSQADKEVDAATAALGKQGASDEISAIEADLEATDLAELDRELENIETELSIP